MTAEPLWLFADQLGPHVHGTDAHREREVVLVESSRVLRRKRFHRQKLRLVLSGMRHLAAGLGDRATYLRTDTYREALARVGRPVVVHEPTSHAALRFVEQLRTRDWSPRSCRRPPSRCRARSSPRGRATARPSGWRTSTGPSAAGSTC